ncbi:MAG: LysM peptidoglycan-binding domain-containing protein [Acidimicrobiales bacterium]
MTVAPMPSPASPEVLDLPWPRPNLYVVDPVATRWAGDPGDDWARDADLTADLAGNASDGDWTGDHGDRDLRPVAPLHHRPSPAVRRRRRGLLLGVAAAGMVAALAVPVAALGGRPAAPPGSAVAAIPGATVYVVQAGDTLWSIAARFDAGGSPRPLAEALARETGSAAVVPGERITVP